MRFQITIDLGNDAMRTRADLADAIAKLAAQLRNDEEEIADGVDEVGSVRDMNGNRVGSWTLGTWKDD